MSNGEILRNGYTLHPAFENNVTGFWIMTDSFDSTGNLNEATSSASNNSDGRHLMRNSEYAAVLFLTRCFENSEVKFGDKEYVAAGCDVSDTGFDIYSLDRLNANYVLSVKGQALLDTPWNLKTNSVLPDSSKKYFLRDVTNGGPFYFEATDGLTSATYRSAISK